MEDREVRPDVPPLRAHLSAVLASLFASLLLLFGGDALGRLHFGIASPGAVSRLDNGQLVAGAKPDLRFLTASDPTSRHTVRTPASGDGCLVPEPTTSWACRHGDIIHAEFGQQLFLNVTDVYRSRGPPAAVA